jgi:hypothetical protein
MILRDFSLPDFVPHSAWAELEIAHRSRVKAVYQKIEIFSTSDYAAQLKWIPIFLGEYDIKRFPQVIIDSLELSEDAIARTALSAKLVAQAAADATLNLALGADIFRGNTGFDANTNLSINDLQDNEATRWLVPRQHSMYFQPRQMRTLTKHFYPTKGKPRDIQSGMIAGIYLQNANIKEGSFDFRVTTTFGEFVRDPDTFSDKSYQDLKQTETFFIPAYYQAHDYEGNSPTTKVIHSQTLCHTVHGQSWKLHIEVE